MRRARAPELWCARVVEARVRAARFLASLALASCATTPAHTITLTAPPAQVPAPLHASRACVLRAKTFQPRSPLRVLTRSGEPFAELGSADGIALTIDVAPTLAITTRGVRL